MAERTKQRERARQERLRKEAEAAAQARRKRLTQLGAGAGFLAVVVVAALILVSQSGSGSGSGGDTSIEGVATVDRELRGLKQDGTVLGDPKAPVTVVEYGDLQCPVCQEYSQQVIPQLIDDEVRTGKAKLDFRNWIVIGSDSTEAAKAALAAAKQGRYWSFVELFYLNQGTENSGYVTDSFLEAIARGAGVPDMARWNRDRDDPSFDSTISSADTEAARLGFTGTPSFAVRGRGGVSALGTPSLEGIESAIKEAG